MPAAPADCSTGPSNAVLEKHATTNINATHAEVPIQQKSAVTEAKDKGETEKKVNQQHSERSQGSRKMIKTELNNTLLKTSVYKLSKSILNLKNQLLNQQRTQ